MWMKIRTPMPRKRRITEIMMSMEREGWSLAGYGHLLGNANGVGGVK